MHRHKRAPEDYGLWYLFRKIGHLFEAGKVEWLGDVDIERLVMDERLSKNVAIIDAVPLEKLHRTNKLKSGFVGVFANGTNFRAQARVSFSQVGSKYIGAFKSAEEAALRRREYYITHKLPYGEYEIETDSLLGIEGMHHLRGVDHNTMRREVLTQMQLTGRTNDYDNDGFSFMPPEIDEPVERIEFKAPAPTGPLRGTAMQHANVAAMETKIANTVAKDKGTGTVFGFGDKLPAAFDDNYVPGRECGICHRSNDECRCP